jgi:hypothetical protein
VNAVRPALDKLGVPTMPLADEQANVPLYAHNLFRKNMYDAAKADADYRTWTTGAQQGQRYSLGAHGIDELHYSPEEQKLYAYGPLGSDSPIPDLVGTFPAREQDLPGMIGKDLSQRLLSRPLIYGPGWGDYQRQYLDNLGGISVGGQGMQNFYDKAIPKIAAREARRVGMDPKEVIGQTQLSGGTGPSRDALDNANAAALDYFTEMTHETVEPDELPAYEAQIRDGNRAIRTMAPEDAHRYLVREGIIPQDEDLLSKHQLSNVVHSMKLTPEAKQTILAKGLPFMSLPVQALQSAVHAAKMYPENVVNEQSGDEINRNIQSGGPIMNTPQAQQMLRDIKLEM